MADKKNIVIKVKYPTASKKKLPDTASPTTTEWDFKKIAGAFLVVLLIAFVFTLNNEKSPQKQVALDQKKPTSKAVNPNTTPKAMASINNFVVRAQLTSKIVDNEPIDNLSLPLKIPKKGSTSIYFFAELNALKGRTIFHEWLLNDALISRKKVHVSSEAWRTASRQVFSYTSETNWTIRLVDEDGKIITEKRFDVAYE